MLLFWKPASTYSPGHVSASHIVLFFATRHKVPSALAGAQCVPFRVVKMRRRSPRSSFRRNYRVACSFSLRGARVLRPRAPMLLQDENNVLSCVTYNSSQPCAQHLGRTRQIVFGAELQNKKPTLLCELFFGNRRRRVAIRAYPCLCRSAAAQPSPCARSLLYATGKCKPFRCSSFLRNYRIVSHFSVAFS